jgi:hypothetical protein
MEGLVMKQTTGRVLQYFLFACTLGPAMLTATVNACELKITWKAALAPIKATPAPVSTPLATAAIDFDFVHPGATIQVSALNLADVRAVELHVTRSYTDHTGPAVLTLYTTADGPLPTTLTKRVTEADLHKKTTPKIAAFTDLVNAVLNGRAYVTVATKAHPEGELSGIIRMHKEQTYSDKASDSAHDAALHHTALIANP